MHHKIRWSDGIIIIHHEFVVVQPGTDFRQDLTPVSTPPNNYMVITLTES